MNIGFVSCCIFCLLFLLLALLFSLLREKGALLIGGFVQLPKGERARYDQARMSRDQRNAFLRWALVWGIGALLCFWAGPWPALAALAVWLVLFFQGVHGDAEKAFEKYRRL